MDLLHYLPHHSLVETVSCLLKNGSKQSQVIYNYSCQNIFPSGHQCWSVKTTWCEGKPVNLKKCYFKHLIFQIGKIWYYRRKHISYKTFEDDSMTITLLEMCVISVKQYFGGKNVWIKEACNSIWTLFSPRIIQIPCQYQHEDSWIQFQRWVLQSDQGSRP